MSKRFGLVALMILLVAGFAFAQSQPSAKATAKVGKVEILDGAIQADGWATILSNNLKTSNSKSIFVDVSIECGLYTRTLVRSKGGERDTSTAKAAVRVKVLVDGKMAYPEEVVFCSREQTLSATLGGIFSKCEDADLDGHITLDECTLTEEEIELILDTMNANAFNFVTPSLSPGVHLIEVQAQLDTDGKAAAGETEAKATIGKGSVTMEEVRLAVGDDVEL